MYTDVNFTTKKKLVEAVKAGTKITVYQPGLGDPPPRDGGPVYLEGPHYPKPHSWYAQAWLENGFIVKVK